MILVGGEALLRIGLSALLAGEAVFEIVGDLDPEDSLLVGVQSASPDVVVLGVEVESGGLELIKDLHYRFPRLPILMLSHRDEALYAPRALSAGARGFLSKSAAPQSVVQGLRRVLQGSYAVSDRVLALLLDGKSPRHSGDVFDLVSRLSDRELQTFELLGDGVGTRQIAQALHISVKTVENYREHIKQKLRLATGAELLHCAIQWHMDRNGAAGAAAPCGDDAAAQGSDLSTSDARSRSSRKLH